jgi:hypothetical protein
MLVRSCVGFTHVNLNCEISHTLTKWESANEKLYNIYNLFSDKQCFYDSTQKQPLIYLGKYT